MEFSGAVLLKYFARILCAFSLHSLKKCYYCQKCNDYSCNDCKEYSACALYKYCCSNCKHYYCNHHYAAHYCEKTIHFFRAHRNLILCDPHTDACKTIPLCHNYEYFAESISYCDGIYITCGKFDILSQLFLLLKLKSFNITEQSPLFIKKCYQSLCSYRWTIFSIGGMQLGFEPIADCEQYNVYLNKWKQLPNLNNARCTCAVFIIKNMIYAMCGYEKNQIYSNSIERLSLTTYQKWEFVTVLYPPSPRSSLEAIDADGVIYIIGGYKHE